MKSIGKLALYPLLLLGVGLSTLTGCGSSPTRIEANIVAAADLNPDYSGQASPLVVRLYQLKSPVAFNNASFFALYDSDAAALGDDLKGREEIELKPGDNLEIERELQPETRFIGLLAGYRDIENASWRAVAEVPEGETTDLRFDFGRLAVKIVDLD
jgi:type VI secretion system protein VasD